MSFKCQICSLELAKYKCPKCAIRYCSLACFKNSDKHVHDERTIEDKPAPKPVEEKPKKQLTTEQFNTVYQETPEIQELLGYNTVKFHLAKVHRILSTGGSPLGTSDAQMSTEAKQQLAVDYLNTLRYGGVHYNEAIEEFCQISLGKLTGESAES
ncbi:LANO_0F15148g1_1 [Lachancea nothofagi CBS 11611]|uniref:LANO_0F15148g1_1 n=1 Tax=Lachancea nothofagi CBS 11611 TaxID=1266666 RepID=A0A1G4KCI7_9SACH|nr:LANO_0F15148g1_1 [Lachancea nothofagi CBS 11611]